MNSYLIKHFANNLSSIKKLFILTVILQLLNYEMQAQVSHLSLVHDFDGNNFDYSVEGMVGANDSLYILSSTPDHQGMFFRIDENGDGYKVIWKFDDINWLPNSIAGNDTAIYITTRLSRNSGGALFKYSLKDYSFKLVKDFSPEEAQEVSIKYVTDSVLWFSSLWSNDDKGSIFTTNVDGTGFKKIYNDTNLDKGLMPADFFFYEKKIYIAFYGGGGTPYPDGNGGVIPSGCFVRINTDGTGYENIIPGGDRVGTQPQSLIIRDDKIFGLFAYSGSHSFLGAQFFRSNLDGSSYDSLGGLNNRALTRLLSTDSLIYGISAYNVFGINPFDGEIRIFEDLLSNPDFGEDVVSSPAYLNGHIFIAAQQGGPNGGGTILKWSNEPPQVDVAGRGRLMETNKIDLKKLFTDPNGDRLTYKFEYDHESVTITESNGILTCVSKTFSPVEVKIVASDGWTGHASTRITLDPSVTTNVTTDVHPQKFILFPNPTHSVLKFTASSVESIQILDLDGKIHQSFLNPQNEINISSLNSGMYFVRTQINGVSYWQKIIKH